MIGFDQTTQKFEMAGNSNLANKSGSRSLVPRPKGHRRHSRDQNRRPSSWGCTGRSSVELKTFLSFYCLRFI